jgi:surface protein
MNYVNQLTLYLLMLIVCWVDSVAIPKCNYTTSTQRTCGIRKVVDDYLAAATSSSTITTYGEISDWEVSDHTDFSFVFYNKIDFNADLSKWNTSKVTNLYSSKYKNKKLLSFPLWCRIIIMNVLPK